MKSKVKTKIKTISFLWPFSFDYPFYLQIKRIIKKSKLEVFIILFIILSFRKREDNKNLIIKKKNEDKSDFKVLVTFYNHKFSSFHYEKKPNKELVIKFLFTFLFTFLLIKRITRTWKKEVFIILFINKNWIIKKSP